MSKHSILLLKDKTSSSINEGNSSPSEYETILSQLGCDVYFISPLQFDFLNIDIIENQLHRPDNYSGVVLTSPRSVEACAQAFKRLKNEQDLTIWRKNKICYAVGPSTAMKAGQDLMWEAKQIRGGDKCGNAHALAEYIIEDYKSNHNGLESQPLLYPCGNLKRETLTEELKKHGNINLETITCYKTSPNKELEEQLKQLSIQASHIDMVVFFSPSGVKFSWKLLLKYFKRYSNYIAIGPTTLGSLRSYCDEEDLLFESKYPSAVGIRDVAAQIIENL